MPEYIPSPRQWVRDQVELYEGSGGTQGTTLRDTGLPVIVVTHSGNKTGAIRKTPLMQVKDGANRGDAKLLASALRELRHCFRVFANYRTRILFYCGKLQLAPDRISH